MYLQPENIPRAVVLTLGNKVVLSCIEPFACDIFQIVLLLLLLFCFVFAAGVFSDWWLFCKGGGWGSSGEGWEWGWGWRLGAREGSEGLRD